MTIVFEYVWIATMLACPPFKKKKKIWFFWKVLIYILFFILFSLLILLSDQIFEDLDFFKSLVILSPKEMMWVVWKVRHSLITYHQYKIYISVGLGPEWSHTSCKKELVFWKNHEGTLKNVWQKSFFPQKSVMKLENIIVSHIPHTVQTKKAQLTGRTFIYFSKNINYT